MSGYHQRRYARPFSGDARFYRHQRAAIYSADITNLGLIESTDGVLIISGSLTIFGNSGTLEANGGELDLSSDALGNTGTLQAIDNSTLKLRLTTVTNTGNGTMTVDGGSTLDLVNATISGGTLTISGTLDSTGTDAIYGADIANSGLIESAGGILTIDPAGARDRHQIPVPSRPMAANSTSLLRGWPTPARCKRSTIQRLS